MRTEIWSREAQGLVLPEALGKLFMSVGKERDVTKTVTVRLADLESSSK